MNYLVITKKKWSKKNYSNLSRKFVVKNKINSRILNLTKPKIIFFIHWSKIIKKEIYSNYKCIQFHSSNLPEGRGGSPIQNQILKGFKKTKLTAFKINHEIDGGPICMKKTLSLNGTALDILKRMEKLSIIMIKKIIEKKNLIFKKQKKTKKIFTRRKKSESNINNLKSKNITNLFDFIRMLDAPGYPHAFIKNSNFIFKINDAKIRRNKLIASAEITNNEKKR